MNILRYRLGCPPPGKANGCFGPIGPYWTLFNTELRYLAPYALFALFVAIAVFFVAFHKIKLWQALLLGFVTGIVFLLACAYFLPLQVQY